MDRYTLDRCCDGCSMSRDPEGGWVEIDEVAKLSNRVEELEAAALCGCGDQFNADFPGICPSCLVVKEIERDDLAMLTRLLIRKVRKTSPDDKTARKALDFLTRHNLQGSPLR